MVIDARVWVSYVLPHDKHHAVSVSWLEALSEAGAALSAPTLLLPELAGAIARRSGNPEFGIEAAKLLGSTLVIWDEEQLSRGGRVVPTRSPGQPA